MSGACRSSRRAGARSTDPWTQQPQPKCGFVLVGSDGSIASYDYDDYRHAADAEEPGAHQGAGRRRCRRAGAPRSSTCSPASTTARRSPVRSTRRSASSASASSTAPSSRLADEMHRRAGRHERARPRRLRAEDRRRGGSRRARPALPAADAEDLPAADRAGRRRRHLGRASRRLSGDGARRGGHLQPHALQGRGAGATSIFPSAEATGDIDGTLTRDDIEVVDITPHPAER